MHNPKLTNNQLKRQWGTETNTHPLSRFHTPPTSLNIAFSRLSIVLTIILWIIYVFSVIFKQLFEGPDTYNFTLEAWGYLIVVTFLTFSALMYLLARQGALQRFSKHIRTPRAILEHYFSNQQPSITVLVPSYNEEPEVIRKTLLSAALQEYPNMKVVLLIDDKPDSTNPKLTTSRQLHQDIQSLLSKPANRFQTALSKFEKNYSNSKKSAQQLANHYIWAANWLNQQADKQNIHDHVDIFFTDQVFRNLAKDLKLISHALMVSHDKGVKLSSKRIHQLYQRLVWIFTAKLDVFERKQFISLSHEANKAMNLNSYIGLMGNTYQSVTTTNGKILVPNKKPSKNTITIPDSDYLLTLDADSILLREYCLRLIHFLEQPENADVAITQTPYSSFRGASSRIERLSSATTDIQHILHQGMSHYNATFWVGANAVIRKKALQDIAIHENIGGFNITRYIQDNTVIEDTESSIDLALHGWRLVNYPERLSYSATPPDFGSLIIQRRRWANGGLLILPKLIKQIRYKQNKGQSVNTTEILLRLNYMASIAWSNLGLVFLLAYPYDGRLLSPLVLLAALPYFISMAIDLKYCRYSYTDIIKIYGFNLILLPVNLAGVFKSLQQALTNKKIPFARTPKVKNRTVSGLPYVISPLLILAFSLFTMWRNIETQNWGNATFAGFNAFASTLAIISYIGIKNLIIDIWLGIVDFLYVETKTSKNKSKTFSPVFDWKSILYYGDETGNVPHLAVKDLVSQAA